VLNILVCFSQRRSHRFVSSHHASRTCPAIARSCSSRGKDRRWMVVVSRYLSIWHFKMRHRIMVLPQFFHLHGFWGRHRRSLLSRRLVGFLSTPTSSQTPGSSSFTEDFRDDQFLGRRFSQLRIDADRLSLVEDDCVGPFELNPFCADVSWSLWNATEYFTGYDYFCCLPGQVGLQNGECTSIIQASLSPSTAVLVCTFFI
jgi:hypothetical protein